eukprot:TRINITY_DN5597_c1_g1_i33.p1 TRINITY_DN5597_c1_g1~~TRINITY_DN5597_c1_g1_i33.p1  ORF type:complete len:107 (-),score=13.89 TRINITY_DN5597_c1_g1_i33:128-448(-)
MRGKTTGKQCRALLSSSKITSQEQASSQQQASGKNASQNSINSLSYKQTTLTPPLKRQSLQPIRVTSQNPKEGIILLLIHVPSLPNAPKDGFKIETSFYNIKVGPT